MLVIYSKAKHTITIFDSVFRMGKVFLYFIHIVDLLVQGNWNKTKRQ